VGEVDKVISDCSEAVRLDPKNASPYVGRGNALSHKGEYDKALSDYNEAIRLDPKDSSAHNGRGIVWSAKGRPDKAVCDFNEAIRLDPKNAMPWNNRAWLAATCPDAKYRDGKKAVADATKACELTAWRNARTLDALAAANAEAGDLPKAIRWEKKAIGLVSEKSTGDLRSRLELYKAHKPYREDVKKL
jgi:Flp pilus assembly protein TadD